MGWNYMLLANLISAMALFALHITRGNDVPWYLTAILCLNFILVIVPAVIMDLKNSQRDEKIEQLEKELHELKQEKNKEN